MVTARGVFFVSFFTFVTAVALVCIPPVPLSADTGEALEHHRNLGKAFFENPTTHLEAIAEFKKALDLAPDSTREKLNYALALLHGNRVPEGVALLEQVQKLDPSLPHTWFNLGIYYKKSDQPEKSQAQFVQLVRLVPDEPIAHYQLGTVYRAAGRAEDAIREFEKASSLNPLLAGARFQLYNMYRQAGRREDAAHELAIFQKIKKDTEGAAIPEDVDWCNYAEIYDPPRASTAIAGKPVYEDRIVADAAGMVAIDAAGDGHTDLIAWSGGKARLYRNGVEPVSDSGLEQVSDVVSVSAGDFDNDGLADLCVLTGSGPKLFHNVRGRFAPFDAALPQRRFEQAIWIDYDHDYDLDLLLLGGQPALMRNQGKAGFEDRDFPFVPAHFAGAYKLRAVPDSKAFDLAAFYSDHAPVLYVDQLGGRYIVTPFTGPGPADPLIEGDFNGDGLLDQARIAGGKLHVMINRSAPQRYIRVRLTGVKNLKLGEDALVEIKVGAGYWKRTYHGVPLLFPVGANPTVDVLRITWPNGLIQNETNQATNKTHNYEEAQRLSGSCPMVWTFNGHEFEFITDVLGVAPLGASDGEGSYFPVDHDEWVTIPARALHRTGDRYEVRITEELSEVSYLDQVELYALDHPANKEIFTNEKFKGPPYPEFRLYEAPRRIYPKSARDDQGHDVLSRLLKRDRKYPDQFKRTKLGVAEVHALELDFSGAAASGEAVLLASGWVDWPDGSTFRAASQEKKGGLVMPYLQMRDASGKWVTVNEDMGMPAGKPKTIAVPLNFISSSRQVRIVTDLCVYWDEIFLSETAGPAEAHQQRLPLASADLRFRGFSESVIDPKRQQPDTFLYNNVDTPSYWNPTPGMYTRYGDVRELADRVDDKLIIMGSGDELRLLFDAASLAPPPAGWTRDYLLKVDGWAKDRDPNTAFSQTVEPLPFHGMSRYPYPANEHFPDDEAHRHYQREYNTRPALHLVRPLTNSGGSQ